MPPSREMGTELEFSISKWETVLSDVDGLYFISLLNQGERLVLTVEDRSGQQYEVIVERPGPYRMVDEQFLTAYWGASEKGRGWTFQVTGAEWTSDLSLLDHYAPDLQHFGVGTYDLCLEVLAAKEPQIRVL